MTSQHTEMAILSFSALLEMHPLLHKSQRENISSTSIARSENV